MNSVLKVTKAPGDGKTFPQRGQRVTVDYTGQLLNGRQFDSSEGRDPFVFTIGKGEVIRGWDEGVAQMSLGETALLRISPEYGYGARGAGNDIPPNSTLIFLVKLLKIDW